MTVVNPKSISGINSITTGSGSDDILTIHTNNGTERLRIDSTGTTKIVTGIVTTLTATTGIVTTLTANTVTSLGAVSGTTGTFTGDVDIADKIVHTGDTNTAIRFPSADVISFENGGTETARASATNQFSVGTTADIAGVSVSIGGSVRLVNANDRTATISALPSGTYNTGHSGGSAIAFHRVSDGGGGSDEIAFETHHQGSSHAESLRIEKAGDIKVNRGDLYFGTAGKGIVLGATSNTDANTLDDYEEGTWTPDVRFSNHLGEANQLSYHSRNGYYTKVGNTVTIYGFFNISSLNGKTGNFYMFGLPHAPLSGTNPLITMIGDGFNFGSNEFGTTFLLIEGGNNRAAAGWQRETGWSYVTNSNIESGGMYLSGFYYV